MSAPSRRGIASIPWSLPACVVAPTASCRVASSRCSLDRSSVAEVDPVPLQAAQSVDQVTVPLPLGLGRSPGLDLLGTGLPWCMVLFVVGKHQSDKHILYHLQGAEFV